MFTTPARTKGGAPQLGARHPGESGPFGVRPHPDDLDDDGGGLDDEDDQDHDDLSNADQSALPHT